MSVDPFAPPPRGVEEMRRDARQRRRFIFAGVALTAVALTILFSLQSSPTPVDTRGWVLATDPAVHFTARLPVQPNNNAPRNLTIGSDVVTVTVAVADPAMTYAGDGIEGAALVAVADGTEPVPAGQQLSELRSAIFAIVGAPGLSVRSQGETTFQGHPAWRAKLSAPDGSKLEALAYAESDTRGYILIASTNVFTAVRDSFVPTA